MRRPAAVLVATALVATALAGCESGGGGGLPTNLPSATATGTRPTVTRTTAATSTSATSNQSRTDAVGPTSAPSTVTSTATATVTRTATATVTRTETATVTTTATASPSTSETAGETAPQPQESTSGGLPAWAWVLLALVLVGLAVLATWLVRRARVRSAWDERLASADQEARWVEDSLVDQVAGRATAAEARQTWQAAQPRLMALDASLYELSTTAPDPERSAVASRQREALTGLVDAVGAETSTGTDATADDLRTRRAAVTRAREELRGLLTASTTNR